MRNWLETETKLFIYVTNSQTQIRPNKVKSNPNKLI